MNSIIVLPSARKKVAYEQVALLLEHEWKKEFDQTDITSINQHCDDMIGIVEACGWDVSDFIRRMMRYPDRS